jgi:hypothetical protein
MLMQSILTDGAALCSCDAGEYMLGRLCEAGVGGARDTVAARAWYTIAAAHRADATGRQQSDAAAWASESTSPDELMVCSNGSLTHAPLLAHQLTLTSSHTSPLRPTCAPWWHAH